MIKEGLSSRPPITKRVRSMRVPHLSRSINMTNSSIVSHCSYLLVVQRFSLWNLWMRLPTTEGSLGSRLLGHPPQGIIRFSSGRIKKRAASRLRRCYEVGDTLAESGGGRVINESSVSSADQSTGVLLGADNEQNLATEIGRAVNNVQKHGSSRFVTFLTLIMY